MKHPQRYPKHEGDKGTVFDGTCNRTACDRRQAQLFNRGTYGYYCAACGKGINQFNPGLCIRVDHDLTREEMDASAAEMREAS